MPALFNETLLREFPTERFTGRKPFPWFDFADLLTPEAFAVLLAEYPSLEHFERHQNIERAHGQRPHNRYYLAYESTIYDGLKRDETQDGVIHHSELSPAWQTFMTALETDTTYRGFISRLLGLPEFKARYAWHIGVTGSEVSPHRDADAKLGTHIFYFNTQEDWDPKWGGSTLALAGKKVNALNPDFSDFTGEEASQIIDNHSFLFKNTPEAWHGVRTLTCPPGSYRRLFNVIFEAPVDTRKKGGLLGKLAGMVSR